MNLTEAYEVLGIDSSATKDEIKSAFKKNAAKYHPDVNKSNDAEDKFKKVGEAYQLLTNPNPSNHFRSSDDEVLNEIRRRVAETFRTNIGMPMGDPFMNFSIHNIPNGYSNVHGVSVEPIIVNLKIPFKISVIGSKEEIKYNRDVFCCNKTYCERCKGTGKVNITQTVKVKIPPGTSHSSRLVLKGVGHFVTEGLNGNVIVNISVEDVPNMILSGLDVISTIELSLLEALKGTRVTVNTIHGNKTLTINPKTKHGDKIRVSGYGTPPLGAHIFHINVNYPKDVSRVIEFLEGGNVVPEEISGEKI